MAKTIIVKLDGLPDLLSAMGEIAGMQWASQLINNRLGNVQQRVAQYPPRTEANRSRGWRSGGPNGWYERGYGPRWVRKDGSIGGRKTSQMLNRSWSHRVINKGSVIAGEIGSRATYSPWVNGPDQAAVHTRTGWRLLEDEAVTEAEKLTEDIATKVESIWGKG